MKTKTAACDLCQIPSKELLLYEDEDIFLVQTKQMKGHDVRVMAAIKTHRSKPTFEEETKAYSILINYMQKTIGLKKWFIVNCQTAFSSVPQHWHLIACDEKGTSYELELLAKTPKVKFPLGNTKRLFDKETLRCLIGIPAYNESETIAEVVEKAKKFGDVIVCDDGSNNNTSWLATNSGAEVIRLTRNRGYGFCLARLLDEAKKRNYDILVTLDADLQHNPNDIAAFLEALDDGADLAVGDRFSANSKVPFVRKLGIKAVGKIFKLKNGQCGFRALNRKALSSLKIQNSGFGGGINFIEQAKKLNLKIAEVPCNVNYNVPKPHKKHAAKQISDLVDTLLWMFVYKNPILTLGVPAFLVTLVGCVMSILLFGIYASSRFFSYGLALLSFGSLITGFLLGITTIIVWVFKKMEERLAETSQNK